MNKLEEYVCERWEEPLPIALELECLAQNIDWLDIESEREMRAYLKDCFKGCMAPEYIPKAVDRLIKVEPFKVTSYERYQLTIYLYSYKDKMARAIYPNAGKNTIFVSKRYEKWYASKEEAYREFKQKKELLFENPIENYGRIVKGDDYLCGFIELTDTHRYSDGTRADKVVELNYWFAPGRKIKNYHKIVNEDGSPRTNYERIRDECALDRMLEK